MNRILRTVVIALAATACGAAVNPAASKAYVDRKVEELRDVIAEKSVFTNTLQTIENIYYNTYTNNYTTNVYTSVYYITTNTVQNNYVTNFNYAVTYRTNVTVNVYDTTNITTEVHNTTNLDVWVTNNVNFVTNDIVFTDTVYYTNKVYAVFGYTGVVIRAVSGEGEGLVTSTNEISFIPRADMENSYINSEYEYMLYYSDVSLNGGYPNSEFECIDTATGDALSLNSEWPDLGLSTSYLGASLKEATEMTLIYTRSMFSDTAFILVRAPVGEVERNVREIRYNQTMAAEFSAEARRLVSEDGLEWMDSTGIWWRVTSVYECPAYYMQGDVIKEVQPSEENEIARFESLSWRIKCFDRDGYASPRYLYQLWQPHSPSFLPLDYTTDNEFPAHSLSFLTSGHEVFANAYYTTAITNGAVATNAVRRILFSDDMSSVSGLTKFDNASVGTNVTGELEIYGYSSAGGWTVPVKAYDGDTNFVQWTDVDDFLQTIATAYARNAAWGYDNGILKNCYLQVGRNVYSAAPSGQGSSISVTYLQDGSYGVGVAYSSQTGDYSFTFGLVSTLSQSPLYDTVVFVGTLSHEGGQQRWNGIGSIPIVLVFE